MALVGNAVRSDKVIHLPTGGDMGMLYDSLDRSGAIGSMTRLHVAASLLKLDERNYHPGAYRLTRGMSYIRVARMLRRGLQTPVRVTFNNLRSLESLSAALARQLEPDSAAFARVLTDAATARRMGFTPQTFMAMMIPDTYQFYWNTSSEGFVERMRKEYDRFWNGERTSRLAALGMTREQVVTLASIVYEETKRTDEMATVAGVYVNRLRIGMALQADPTVKFAVGNFALRRIRGAALASDSPYNTYKHAGLPPGPICMPSVAAIDATLGYGHHNYLYFCAKPDYSGYHNFSTTLEQHNRYGAIYHRWLDSEGIR
ncbi:aminodeoxychorismate lyase [Bacteroidia bacterium]|nr:aminodeoxychorismate lyase [Bacteroidia bacterium]